jgi:hypothetical protein
MAKAETVDKFFNAVTDAYDALLDAARSANDRGYRVSRKLIDEIERGQKDALDLTRRTALAPRDIAGFTTAAIRNVTDAQGRVLDLTRQLLDEVTDGQRETRDTFRRVIEANRGAGQAAIEATRDVVGRAGSAVPGNRSNTNGAKAAAGSARKSRETSDTDA